jgi:hypothetical protein
MHANGTSTLLFWLGCFAVGVTLLSVDSRASINQGKSTPKRITYENTSMGEMQDEDGVHLGFTNLKTSDGNALRVLYEDFESPATAQASGAAPAKEHCQGGHGPKTRGSDVLDVAERLEMCRVGQVRFARGTARYRTGRAVERRPNEWASRSFARGSLNG